MLQLLRKNKLFFALFFLYLLIGAFFLFFFSKEESFLYINHHHNFFFDHFFKYATFLGDGRFCIIASIAFLFIRYAYAIIATTAYLLSGLITQVLKRFIFINHERPIAFFKEKSIHIIDGITIHSAHSFPSGHTTSAFCIFTLLALIVTNRFWGFVFFLLALIAAYSRIYLAQHFLEDVYVGSMIGSVTAIFVFLFLMRKFTISNSKWQELSLLNR